MSKILFWDIETAPYVGTYWSLYNKGLPHTSILSDSYLICAAWKFEGDKSVSAFSISEPGNDYELVARLHDVVGSADILVHHNGRKFDLKRLNAKVVEYGLPPLPKIADVDTLRSIKKIVNLPSYRLDYISKLVTGKGKLPTSHDWWDNVVMGNLSDVPKMVAYNKIDVVRLEEVYQHFRPYMTDHPHVGAVTGNGRNESCPNCGSTNMIKRGVRHTAAGIKKQALQCNNCGHYHTIPYVS
jgi:hypothetical protein